MRCLMRQAREDQGLTVNQVAVMLGISASFYYKIEQGMRNPTILLAKRIAELLGKGVDQLFFAHSLDTESKAIDANEHGNN